MQSLGRTVAPPCERHRGIEPQPATLTVTDPPAAQLGRMSVYRVAADPEQRRQSGCVHKPRRACRRRFEPRGEAIGETIRELVEFPLGQGHAGTRFEHLTQRPSSSGSGSGQSQAGAFNGFAIWPELPPGPA